MKQFAMCFLLLSMVLCGIAATPEALTKNASSLIGAPPEDVNHYNPFVINPVTSKGLLNVFNATSGTWLFKSSFDQSSLEQSKFEQLTETNNLQNTPLLLRPSVVQVGVTCSVLNLINPTPGTGVTPNERLSGTADTRQVNGLYIFLYSTPSDPTDFLGEVVSPPVVVSTDMDKMIQQMARRAKAKFPDAEGIVFSNNDLSRCDAVRFK